MTKTRLEAALALACLLAAAAPVAAVTLRLAPADTTVAVGARARLSVILDEAITVRTIDVTVRWDTTLVASPAAGAGALFTTSGHQLFKGYDSPEPGTWHGYCIVLGAEDWVTGPGELFWFDFDGLADGVAAVATVSVYLSDALGDWYPTVEMGGTTIIVGEGGLSAVPAPPATRALRLAPNPFNPRTLLRGEMAAPGRARVTVHDLRGRLVAVMHDGLLETGPFTLAWDGRDRTGQAAPGGVYLFRLESAGDAATTRGVLLK